MSSHELAGQGSPSDAPRSRSTEDPDRQPEPEPDSGQKVVTIRSSLATTDPAVLDVLDDGAIEVLGRLPYSSNATFLVEVRLGADVVQGVYKPERGERPLWDFPTGLWRRERAAYLVARELHLPLVPPTVVRADAPLGVGSVQCFVPARFELHYFDLLRDESHHDELVRLALLDLVMNNTDRKAGHCLVDLNDRLWGIDHGLCFHHEPKVRTVIWDFAGRDLPDPTAEHLRDALRRGWPAELAELLLPAESEALDQRVRTLLERGTLPHDPTGRAVPWPLV